MADSPSINVKIDARKVYIINYIPTQNVSSAYFYASPRPFVLTQTIITNLLLESEVGRSYKLEDITQLLSDSGNDKETAFTKIKDKIRTLGQGMVFSSEDKTWAEVESSFIDSTPPTTTSTTQTTTQTGTTTPPPPPVPVQVGMGNTLSIPMDIDTPIDNMAKSIFGFDKLDKLSVIELEGNIPDREGNIPNEPSEEPQSTGGIKTMLELMTRMQVKIVGFFCESFIIAMKPATKLNEMLFKQDDTKTGETIYTELPTTVRGGLENSTKHLGEIPALLSMIPMLSAMITPATILLLANPLNKLKDKLIGKTKDQAKEVKAAGDLLGQITKFISSPQEAVSSLLTTSLVPGVPSPLENFTIPLPAIGMGLIKIPKLDKLDILNSKPFQHPQILAFTMTTSMMANPLAHKIVLSNLITDPMGELKKVTPNPPSIPPMTSGGTNADLGDTQFTLDITSTGKTWQQITFINKIPNFENNPILKKFYAEDISPDATDLQKRYDGFDFFLKLDSSNSSVKVPNFDNSSTIDKTFWDVIVDAGLDLDTTFIQNFYDILSTNNEYEKNQAFYDKYKEDTSSELYTNLLKETIFPHLSFDEVFGNNADIFAQLYGVANNTRAIFKRNFDLSFSMQIDENSSVAKFNSWTKAFKLKLWNKIPKLQLDKFSIFQNDFSNVMGKAYKESVGLLSYTADESAFINEDFVSNYNEAVGEDGPIIKSPKSTFSIPKIGFASLGTLMSGLSLPAQAKWIFSIVDLFMGSATMFFNMTTGLLEKLIGIIKDIITMKIPSVITKLTDFLPKLTSPSGIMALFMELIVPLLLPLLQPMLKKFNLTPEKFDIAAMFASSSTGTTEASGTTETTGTNPISGTTINTGVAIAGGVVAGAAIGVGGAALSVAKIPGLDAMKAFIMKIVDVVKGFVKFLTDNFMKMIQAMFEMSGVAKLLPIPTVPI